MKALHACLPGVALVLVKQHMSYAGSLELRIHPDRVDSGCVIRNTKLSKINFTHDEADNPTLVLHHEGIKQLFFVLGGSEKFRLYLTGPFFPRDRSVNFQVGLLVCMGHRPNDGLASIDLHSSLLRIS